MGNADINAAWEYHNETKHSLESVRTSAHYLDYSNQPRSYKVYKGLKSVSLPREFPASDLGALEAIGGGAAGPGQARELDLATLAAVLHYSAGVTKWLKIPGGRMAFRAAACTGALYHIELYVVCGDMDGLEAGVYQYSAPESSLVRLRKGDYRGVLVEAAAGAEGVEQAPATVVYTSTYWRNAWKYQARAYRHCFWDGGTIMSNMLAVARAQGLSARVVTGFVDQQVNGLLDLDEKREVSLALAPLSNGSAAVGSPGRVEKLGLETEPVSQREVEYPAIGEMHRASSLETAEDVRAWRLDARSNPPGGLAPGGLVPLRPMAPEEMPRDSIERVIRRRGSSRRFEREAISFEALSTMLEMGLGGVEADFSSSTAPGQLTQAYLIVNAVEGLESGSYVYHAGQGLELLRVGQFRRGAEYLDLGQELAGDAAVNVYLMSELGEVLRRFGNRGYRAAQLEGSVNGGRLYLSAYALGLGATGLTFYDDDVTEFFSPHAEGKSPMFLLAVGVPGRRSPAAATD